MEKKFNYFYKIENKVNGKFYYGVHKTSNLNDNYMGSGKRIFYAIKKYGIENFNKEILLFFDTYDEALNYEIEFVNEELLLDPSCYNLRKGGKGGFSKEESLKGTKIMLNKIWNDPEYIKRHNKRSSELLKKLMKEGIIKRCDWTGRHHTEATKEKMRLTHKKNNHQQGEKHSQFGTCWIYNDVISMKIKKEELDIYLNDGWKKGRKMKF